MARNVDTRYSMKEELKGPQVKDVGLAVVREKSESGEWTWVSYLINLRPLDIEGVIVVSKGYGEIKQEKKATSVLRHYLEELPAQSARKIELVMDELLGLFNEYWLTFFESGKMYDRRFIFVPESISEQNLTDIPLLNARGVLIL